MTRRFAGQVVVVTGASRGLGGGIAVALGREGARLVVGYRRREREAAEVCAAALEAGAESAWPVAVDVRDPASVEQAFRTIEARESRLDGLVTSAGVLADGFFATQASADWDALLETNVRGTLLSARAAIRPMLRAKSGSVVLVSSVASRMANPGQAVYAASKAAIESFAATLAVEVARAGVRVNVVCPGLFDAGMVRATPRDKLDTLLTHVPLQRLGTVDELARVVLFLLSSDSSYVTGQTLVVDGGLSL